MSHEHAEASPKRSDGSKLISPFQTLSDEPFSEQRGDEEAAARPAGPSPTYTVEDALNAIGFGWFQGLMMLYTGFAWMSDAIEMLLLSFITSAAKCDFGLNKHEKTAIGSTVFLGMMLGAYIWGAIADIKGRKVGFFSTAFLTAAFGFASAVAPDYGTLLLFRGIVGFGLGGVPVAFTLFTEFTPTVNRGKFLVIMQSFWTLGAIIEAGMAWIIMPRLGWRMLVGLSAIPMVFLLVFFPFIPESPHWLAVTGQMDKAEQVLQRIAKFNGKPMPSGHLTMPPKDAPLPVHNPPKWWNLFGWVWVKMRMLTDQLSRLLVPALKKTTLLLWFIWVTNALGYYGMVMLATELHGERNEACLVEEPDKPDMRDNDYRDIFITTTAESAGLVLAYFLVDWIGRKKSMTAFLTGCMVFLVPLLLDPSEGPETTFLYMSRASITGSFTVLFIYTPEVYPTAVRSLGFGASTSYSRLGGLFAPLLVVESVDSGEEHVAEAILLVMCGMAAAMAVMLPYETAGQELRETLEVEMTGTNPVYGLPGPSPAAQKGVPGAKKIVGMFKKPKEKRGSGDGGNDDVPNLEEAVENGVAL
ncbi:unnamed protein product [Ostreobium quekettii]|uniref:Major facilitator superfamily (MFS) profile domain-containing protein n=1 Tax=Ostreobium quekettii TaxID=121088 RepID=A0A8S1IT99_9CHLO|nr:unnamed protein product [Ostreobium quekettii]|eukprot:evm.model.scf_357.4 EVM.evm.TU.scf_357.4   scf_357:38581-44159(+)